LKISNINKEFTDEELVNWIKSQSEPSWFKNLILAEVQLDHKNLKKDVESETVGMAWGILSSYNMLEMDVRSYGRVGKLIGIATFRTMQDANKVLYDLNGKEDKIGECKTYVKYDIAAEITIQRKIYYILKEKN